MFRTINTHYVVIQLGADNSGMSVSDLLTALIQLIFQCCLNSLTLLTLRNPKAYLIKITIKTINEELIF